MMSSTSIPLRAATRALRRLGVLGATLGVSAATVASATCAPASTNVAACQTPASMSPDEFRPFTVTEIRPLTGDTSLYRFGLGAGESLAMPVASLLLVRAAIGEPKEEGAGNSFVVRPYTPTDTVAAVGHFDLVVKSYAQGNVSKHFSTLKVGDSVEMKGPITKFVYDDAYRGRVKRVGMIAGGSGITPMLQVARKILRDGDGTAVSLIFANQTPEDIILKGEIDELAAANPNFSVHYTVDRAPAGFEGSVGYITEEMIRANIPQPSGAGDDSVVVYVCGPPGMMNHISGNKNPDKSQGELAGLLKKMEYAESQVYKVRRRPPRPGDRRARPRGSDAERPRARSSERRVDRAAAARGNGASI